MPRLTVLLPVADTMDEAFFTPFLRETGGVIPIKGLPYDCLAHSDAAVIASGSATLEARERTRTARTMTMMSSRRVKPGGRRVLNCEL
jgi:lipid A disaccharide synthetase